MTGRFAPGVFDASGLKAYAAAGAVRASGPLAVGTDGRFWGYAAGVWSVAERDVHTRVCRALGDRYRPALGKAVRDVLIAELPELAMDPVVPYLNLPNGMLRWGAVEGPELVEHHPEYWSTVQLPVSWDPDGACPDFDAFLAQSVAPDDLVRVWQIIGYLMMSGNPLQRAFLLSGRGGNGKGVLLRVLSSLLGRDNVASVPLHDLAEDRFSTAELYGKLANVCGDIDATWIEHTGRIKEITGEDVVKGERKYGQPFYFQPWCKMIFSANSIPGAADSSTGWLRRWEVVEFPHAPAVPDRKLSARLTSEESLQGIMVRGVNALRRLMARGQFDHEESARGAHLVFAQKSNRVLSWIDEEGYFDPQCWYPREKLWRAFRWWDQENDMSRRMSRPRFYELLAQVEGLRPAKIHGERGIRGLRLTRDTAYGAVLGVSDDPQGQIGPETAGGRTDFQPETLL